MRKGLKVRKSDLGQDCKLRASRPSWSTNVFCLAHLGFLFACFLQWSQLPTLENGEISCSKKFGYLPSVYLNNQYIGNTGFTFSQDTSWPLLNTCCLLRKPCAISCRTPLASFICSSCCKKLFPNTYMLELLHATPGQGVGEGLLSGAPSRLAVRRPGVMPWFCDSVCNLSQSYNQDDHPSWLAQNCRVSQDMDFSVLKQKDPGKPQ